LGKLSTKALALQMQLAIEVRSSAEIELCGLPGRTKAWVPAGAKGFNEGGIDKYLPSVFGPKFVLANFQLMRPQPISRRTLGIYYGQTASHAHAHSNSHPFVWLIKNFSNIFKHTHTHLAPKIFKYALEVFHYFSVLCCFLCLRCFCLVCWPKLLANPCFVPWPHEK